jgi:hypothetical protein
VITATVVRVNAMDVDKIVKKKTKITIHMNLIRKTNVTKLDTDLCQIVTGTDQGRLDLMISGYQGTTVDAQILDAKSNTSRE